jgi:hypothetical protein
MSVSVKNIRLHFPENISLQEETWLRAGEKKYIIIIIIIIIIILE